MLAVPLNQKFVNVSVPNVLSFELSRMPPVIFVFKFKFL